LSPNTLNDANWLEEEGVADKVAKALLAWCIDNKASVYTHWFQPLGASGVRHGFTAGVQVSMMTFDENNEPCWRFSGKELKQGETDGSSYMNGHLRTTHRAGGYLNIDTTSPPFIRGDTMFIPACFTSYNGDALDEKTPLLRAGDALSLQGTRLLKLMGFETERIVTNIGLEQEIFLIPRDQFHKRMDLRMAGRTIIGQDAPRGQEMCDHYMAPPSTVGPALACMQEIQEEAFKLGIPLRTRHREVAPNQYEFAPQFGTVTTQTDQNLMVMQILDEVASKHGLAALIQEKPFAGINGSGKHNNWSLGTEKGINLLNIGQISKASKNPDIFPMVMASILQAANRHGDLMRMSISSPGNDFRLGACEAPPAIMSVYLGDTMTKYLTTYASGDFEVEYDVDTKTKSLGADSMGKVNLPPEDRNRTSPFPYGGHRFEFRAVGSSQNVSMVNTVLATIVAESFKEFADKIECGADPRILISESLKVNMNVVFNGNGYSLENQKFLTQRGIWRIDDSIDAICRLSAEKNLKLMTNLSVMSQKEIAARQTAMLEHYVGTVDIEARSLIDMMYHHVIPSARTCHQLPTTSVDDLLKSVGALKSALKACGEEQDEVKKARLARTLRLVTMDEVRSQCDEVEENCAASNWTLPTYSDLLFLDQTS
jgi:glutamine synthetase